MLYIMYPDGERSYCYKIKTGGSFWGNGGSVHSYRKLYVIQLVIRFKRLAVSINKTDKHFNSNISTEGQ